MEHGKKLNPSDGLSIFRLETLEDGVFAIAMTILVFDLKIPENNGLTLWENLQNMIPNILSFFESFILLGIYWFGHRSALHYIKHANHIYHWINLQLLAFVAILPFSTAMLAKHYTEKTAVIIYGLKLIFIGVFLTIQWLYATKDRKMVDPDLSDSVIRFATYRSCFAPVCYFIAILLSLINVWIALVMYFIVPMTYIFPFFQKYWRKAAGM